MKDALGNDLIIGQSYGYSRNQNGVTTVKVGILQKINDSTVSLHVTEAKTALYSRDLERTSKLRAIAVKANGLFPVDEYRIGGKATCISGYNHYEVFAIVGIREKELELEGDWSGGTHSVYQKSWVNKSECKPYK